MKIYQAITILTLISYAYMDKYCSKSINSPTKVEDCSSVKAGGGYCCFVKSNGKNECEGFGPNAYKNINSFVKAMKKCNIYTEEDDCKEDSDFSIDCKSSYLVLSLLSLILLFL